MDALRFSAKSRYLRVALSIVSVSVSLLLASIVVMFLMGKVLINGVIATGWYSYKMFEVNWKD